MNAKRLPVGPFWGAHVPCLSQAVVAFLLHTWRALQGKPIHFLGRTKCFPGRFWVEKTTCFQTFHSLKGSSKGKQISHFSQCGWALQHCKLHLGALDLPPDTSSNQSSLAELPSNQRVCPIFTVAQRSFQFPWNSASTPFPPTVAFCILTSTR